MKKILILLLMITLMFYSACQPTPQIAPVVGKSDGDLEEKITQAQLTSQKYIHPDNWKQNFQNEQGDVMIQVDAIIAVPTVTDFPVVNVMPADIQNDDIKKLVNYFFTGKSVYDDTGEYVKADLEKNILQYKADLVNLQQNGRVHYTLKVFTSEEMLKEKLKIQEIINQLEVLFSKAPDTIERKLSNVELTTDNNYSICNFVDTKSNEYALSFHTSIENDNSQVLIWFSKTNSARYDEFVEIDNEKPIELHISFEYAEKMAKNMLADIGMGEVVTTGSYIANYVGISEQLCGVKNSTNSYVFYFCKPVHGVPITYFHDYEGTTTFGPDGDLDYVFPWDPEVIEVIVSDLGVVSFMWKNPSVILDTINQNVELLSWEDIKKKAIQHLKIKSIGQYIIGGDQDSLSIKINKITLGMMHIAKKDNSTEYMYIPVWDFFGNHISSKNNNHYTERACSLLTINAIDGSIIDRGLGY